MPALRAKAAVASALAAAVVVGGLVYDGTHLTPRAVAAPAPLLAGVSVPGISTTMKDNVPALRIRIQGTDNGTVDDLAGQFLSDILDYWDSTTLPGGGGWLEPPHIAASYNSTNGDGKSVCVLPNTVNAAACRKFSGQTSIEWDRGLLLPAILRAGNMFSVGLVLAHETGHLVDFQLRGEEDIKRRSIAQVLINEQRADCYSGAWLARTAEGDSRRFTVDAKSVDEAVYSVMVFRDNETDKGHGTGVERVNALLRGFISGPDVCAQINGETTRVNREGIPGEGSSDDPTRWEPLSENDVQRIRRAVGIVTRTDPKMSTTPCPESPESKYPAMWCSSRGEVSADFGAFAELPEVDPDDAIANTLHIAEGPGDKIGPLLAALVQPRLTEDGIPSTSSETSCAVGVLSRALVSETHGAILDFGDLDEILSETFRDGRSSLASDGSMEEWALNRAKNFLDGLYRTRSVEGCMGRP